MGFLTKLKEKEKKARHVKFLENKITELYNEILSEVIAGNSPVNKAKLIKKYNNRLKLLTWV
jgi:transposase